MAGLIAWRGPPAGGVVHKRRDQDREARMSGPPPKFHGVSDLREFFRTNQTPIYFVSPTAFNLLGMDRWVRNFHYVTYFDSFEGSHPNVFVPEDRRAPEFESIQGIRNHLLRPPQVLSVTGPHGPRGPGGFVMFGGETAGLGGPGRRRGRGPAGA